MSKKTGLTRADQRRSVILKALRDCVLRQGYAKTRLADIAEAAGMYPSHLLYYFEDKNAILVHYFQDVSQKIIAALENAKSKDPEYQIDLVADLFFGRQSITKSEVGFMLECFGVAVNDSTLSKKKSELDEYCKDYLTALFEKGPQASIFSPKASAEVVYATLIGLRSAVYFDNSLSLNDAHQLFRETISYMAGLNSGQIVVAS